MNVFNFQNPNVHLTKNLVLRFFSLLSEKIILIGSLAFACLAATYLFYRYKTPLLKKATKSSLPSKPQNSEGFRKLGDQCKNGIIKFSDGTQMSQQALYIRAIELDSRNSMAYLALGSTFSKDEKIHLLNNSGQFKNSL